MKFRTRAFSLLESLLALFVISTSLLVIQQLSRLLAQEVRAEQRSIEKDWQIFDAQLRAELDEGTFEKLENNFLYFKKGGQDFRFGKAERGDDFRKTDGRGLGYQPMIHVLRAAKIEQSGRKISIRLDFEKGGQKIFLYQLSS